MYDDDKIESMIQQCIEKKYVDSSLVYGQHRLEKFFDALKEQQYAGPIKKSMFVSHGGFKNKSKELGISLYRNRKTGMYFIENQEFHEPPPEPVLFDPELIDVPS
jgi:hypothetical protein